MNRILEPFIYRGKAMARLAISEAQPGTGLLIGYIGSFVGTSASYPTKSPVPRRRVRHYPIRGVMTQVELARA